MKKMLIVMLLFILCKNANGQTITITNHSSCSYFSNVTASDASPLCPVTTGYYAPGINIPAAKGGVPSVTTINSSAPWSSPPPPPSFVWNNIMIDDYLCGGIQINFAIGTCQAASPSTGTYSFPCTTCAGSISWSWSMSGINANIDIY